MLFRIESVIAEDMEPFLMNVNNEPPNEFGSRENDINAFMILVALIPEGNGFPIIGEDAGLGHGRAADVAGNVIGNQFGSIEFGWRGMNIEAVLVIGVHPIFQRPERILSKPFFKMPQESSLPSFAKHEIGKEFNLTPGIGVPGSPF